MINEIKEKCREKGIKKLLEILAENLKKDPKTRIDPKAAKHPELGKALKYYCSNTIFTKLYMLHCLVNNQHENASLQINTLYYESECFVYLYSTELEQTFMYKSKSLIFSIEMAKYFLIYELYRNCFTIAEIIQTMKNKMEKPKENLVFKQNIPFPEPVPQNQLYQKEKPMYQPVYRGNSQSYYSTTDRSSATASSDSLNSTKSSGAGANNNNSTKVSAGPRQVFRNEDYNKENHLGLNRNNYSHNGNRTETRKKLNEYGDLIEIREPPVRKGIRLRDANTKRSNGERKVLAEIENDLIGIFSDSDDDVKVINNKKPVEAKKFAQKNGVKDLMLEDLDDL